MAEGGRVGRRGWSETKVGTPQGAVVSPLLANIYLHYVFDLWVNQWRRKSARGEVIIVRYADDAVLGFEDRKEAEAFLEQLRERMQKFGLELHSEKTRLIEFGRFAEKARKRRGEGKPETFDFLGFTHSCGKTAKGNWFTIRRQTAKKRLRSKLQAVKQELRQALAQAGGRERELAAVGGARILQLSRGTGQFRSATDVPTGGGSYVAGGATASQPTGSPFVGALRSDRGSFSAYAANSASAPWGSL